MKYNREKILHNKNNYTIAITEKQSYVQFRINILFVDKLMET
jgi:hypothetical protein